MIAVDDFVKKLEIEEPKLFENIAVSRVYGDNRFREDVLILDEVLQNKERAEQFKISDTGVISKLEVENRLDSRVFIACGMILEGRSQNRAVQYPTLVREKPRDVDRTDKTVLFVRCSQHGRGIRAGAGYTGSTTIMKANARSGDVDQHRTWTTIMMSRDFFHSRNDTDDYVSMADEINAELEDYREEAFGECKDNQLGYIAAIRNNGDLFFYSDILGNHDVFGKLYNRLVQSVAVVAKESQGSKLKIRRKSMVDFLNLLNESRINKLNEYDGLGELYVSTKPIDGSLLYLQENPVQYALRKDIFKEEIQISDQHTMILDGESIRQRLRDMYNRD